MTFVCTWLAIVGMRHAGSAQSSRGIRHLTPRCSRHLFLEWASPVAMRVFFLAGPRTTLGTLPDFQCDGGKTEGGSIRYLKRLLRVPKPKTYQDPLQRQSPESVSFPRDGRTLRSCPLASKPKLRALRSLAQALFSPVDLHLGCC